MPRKKSRRTARRKRFRPVRWLLYLVSLLLVVSMLLTLPLRWLNPPTSAYMLRDQWIKDRHVVQVWKPYEAIAWNLKLAVIAAEDQRFAEHYGLDVKAIRQAINEHQRGQSLRGASTISQQVARNLYLWPGESAWAKWSRKSMEAWFTICLETLLPKQRILEIYLNIAELGPAIYGAEAASQHYFSQSAGQLSTPQAAALATLLPSPNNYSMFQPRPAQQARREWVEKQMRQLGGQQYLDSHGL